MHDYLPPSEGRYEADVGLGTLAMGAADRMAGLGLLILAAWVAWETRGLPLGAAHRPGPGYVPLLLAAALAALALALIVRGNGPPLRQVAWEEAGHAAAILGACLFAAAALERLGYRITMALFLLFLLGAVQRRRILVAAALALGFALASYWLFDSLLRVQLPRGPFGL